MGAKIGANTNTYEVAAVEAEVEITVNTAVTAVAADPERVEVIICILTKDAWIRLMPAATDPSTRKGIKVKKDGSFIIGGVDKYKGEISIINKKNGEKPIYYITKSTTS